MGHRSVEVAEDRRPCDEIDSREVHENIRHTARLRRSDTRGADHHARYHQKQPDIRRPFEGARPRKRRRKPLHAARPAEHIPDNGDKYGGSRRGNGPAPGDAQPHCRQLRRRS